MFRLRREENTFLLRALTCFADISQFLKVYRINLQLINFLLSDLQRAAIRYIMRVFILLFCISILSLHDVEAPPNPKQRGFFKFRSHPNGKGGPVHEGDGMLSQQEIEELRKEEENARNALTQVKEKYNSHNTMVQKQIDEEVAVYEKLLDTQNKRLSELESSWEGRVKEMTEKIEAEIKRLQEALKNVSATVTNDLEELKREILKDTKDQLGKSAARINQLENKRHQIPGASEVAGDNNSQTEHNMV